ncbi:hypothetical protein OIO90_005064 [Microbotryomycetes sp. JL221]|nr:hypothetical protein OIO90_005064 [Microbotryomycetes sp. JL221]
MLFSVASVIALAASTRAAPIAASLQAVEAALSLPNTTQTNDVVFYYQNGNAGACGLYSQDSDLVVGLPYEFYNQTGMVSSYCGAYMVIKGVQTNKTVTARVADASATNNTLSLSVATWRALDGDAGLETVKWRFANATETDKAKEALDNDNSEETTTTARAASTTAARAAAATTTTKKEEPKTTAAAPKTTTTTSEYVAPTTTSSVEYTPESTSQYVAPTTTTTTSEWVAPTTTTTEAPQATQQSYQSDSSASSGSYSGTATYFYQGGAAGNCGIVHSDSDYIVALTTSMYSGGSHCGQGVHICSTSTGRCVDATVADSCPSCSSSGDLDLSEAAFNAIASPSDGVTSISWSFN